METSPLLFVWIAITVIVAVLLGASAGVLAWLDERRAARAVLVGGGTAGGVLIFALTAGTFFEPGR